MITPTMDWAFVEEKLCLIGLLGFFQGVAELWWRSPWYSPPQSRAGCKVCSMRGGSGCPPGAGLESVPLGWCGKR